MPFTSGTYSLPSGNPVASGTTISSTTTNTTNSDIATALSACLLKDGTQTVTANIPMASHKFTGLIAGSATGDSARYDELILKAPLASPTFTGNTTASFVRGEFRKDAPSAVAFVTTAAFAVSTQTQMYIDVNGTCLTFASGVVVSMPSAVTGTDYAIWAETAGTLTCTNNFSTPPTANARKIGGFHYAPGGNATAQAGGNSTPAINAYSFWDLKFKPACQDPRGMTLVADNFWADIYLLNTDTDTNGTSKYNVTIADGASPPKIPAKFGGNGTTAYTTLTWWEANEVLAANGKRSASYQEYAALAYGTTEGASVGADQVSTILNAVYTSRWGVMQSTGVMDVWGKDFGGGAAGTGWVNNTTGRGQTYQLSNAVIFGGSWDYSAGAGSRSSNWSNSPANSGGGISGRGVCDHLLLD